MKKDFPSRAFREIIPFVRAYIPELIPNGLHRGSLGSHCIWFMRGIEKIFMSLTRVDYNERGISLGSSNPDYWLRPFLFDELITYSKKELFRLKCIFQVGALCHDMWKPLYRDARHEKLAYDFILGQVNFNIQNRKYEDIFGDYLNEEERLRVSLLVGLGGLFGFIGKDITFHEFWSQLREMAGLEREYKWLKRMFWEICLFNAMDVGCASMVEYESWMPKELSMSAPILIEGEAQLHLLLWCADEIFYLFLKYCVMVRE